MRHIRIPLVVAALLAFAAAPGHAATLMSSKLTAGKAVPQTCHEQLLRSGAAGAVQRRVTVPKLGLVRARLTGPKRGDWDLAVFNRAGRAIAAFRDRQACPPPRLQPATRRREAPQRGREAGRREAQDRHEEAAGRPSALPTPSQEAPAREGAKDGGDALQRALHADQEDAGEGAPGPGGRRVA